jgi:hypothetical protein
MNKEDLILQSQAYLRDGDTAAAMSVIAPFLRHEPLYRGHLRQFQVLESRLAMLRDQQIKGTIALTDAQREGNQINEGLYRILEDLAAGKTSPDHAIGRPKWHKYLLLLLGLPLLGISIWFAFFLPTAKQAGCPPFRENVGHILILPFQKVAGEDTNIPLALQTRIQNIAKDKLPIHVALHDGTGLPAGNPDTQDASQIAAQCDADMVIWGIYTNEPNQPLMVNTRHLIYRTTDGIARSGFEHIPDLGDLVNDGQLRTIDDAVLSLCSVMAFMRNDTALTKRWLNRISQKTRRDEQFLNND